MENEKYLSTKLRKAIEDSGMTDDILAGLYDIVEGMDDEELKEYIYTNAQYFRQNMPMAVDEIPELKTLVNVEPNWGVNDNNFSKLFGQEDVTEEEFLRNFDNVPYSTIKYVAEQHGMNPKKLEKAIREKQLRQTREDIANGYGEGPMGKAAAFITRTMFPNIVEGAVKEGRDPTLGEVAVDVGSNLMYAVPWGSVIGGTSKVAKIGANAIAPAVSEGLDMAFNDNDKTAGERLSNVGVGTLVNFATPYVLKRYGSRTARMLGENAEQTAKKIGMRSADEIVSEQIEKEQRALNQTKKAMKKYDKTGDVNDLTADEYNALFSADNLGDVLHTANSPYDNAVRDVARQTGDTFNKKLKKSSSKTREMFKNMSETEKDNFSKQVATEWSDTYYTSPIAGANKVLGSFGTNKLGDVLYSDRPESIPMAGPALSKAGLIESKREKERQERLKQRKLNKEEARKKYEGNYTREMLENSDQRKQWEAGFKPNKIPGDETWEAYKQWYFNKYGEMPR